MTARTPSPVLYLSLPHACSYLPGRMATTLFVDPHHLMTPELHARFTRHGFRRSGDLVYRPHCPDCAACLSARIPVASFQPSRGQRRAWKRNGDVRVIAREPVFDEQHYALYLRYQEARHPGSGMSNPSPERYLHFLVGRGVRTVFYELRAGPDLLGVAVVDCLPDALSAVYTFYDPSLTERSLGVYAVLWQIQHARELSLPWVYLGYWIKNSVKMNYKSRFRPLEIYHQGRWSLLRPSQ